MVAHPHKKNILTLDIATYEWGRTLLAARRGRIHYVFDGVAKSAVFDTSDTLRWTFVATMPDAELNAPGRRIGWWMLGVGLGGVCVASVAMMGVARSIAGPLHRIAGQLTATAAETKQAAAQLSSASQSLSESSSEQAAALEESSASLEEIAGMTKRNADGAARASHLAREATQSADAGAKEMRAMHEAMNAIKSASDDIAKIYSATDFLGHWARRSKTKG